MGERLKALWANFKTWLAGIWSKDGLWIILAAVGALFFKFRDLIIDILINSAKRVEDNAQKKDQQLASEETSLKQQADVAVQQAQNEPSKQEPVTDDWYKKKS